MENSKPRLYGLRGADHRTLLEAGRIALPRHDALRRELLTMKYQITGQGKIKVVDPSDSPDLLDAILVALSSASRGSGRADVVWGWKSSRLPELTGSPMRARYGQRLF